MHDHLSYATPVDARVLTQPMQGSQRRATITTAPAPAPTHRPTSVPSAKPAAAPSSPKPVALEAAPKPEVTPVLRIGRREAIFGLVVIAVWFNLFAGGILIPTNLHRERLQVTIDPSAKIAASDTTNASTAGAVATASSKAETGEAAKREALKGLEVVTAWLLIIGFWTITNIGILSVLAAMIGTLAHRNFVVAKSFDPDAKVRPEAPAPTQYLSAVLRGFGIYALVLAGLLVAASTAFSKPTQSQYIHLAATISIISFYAGYDARIFTTLLGRVRRFTEPDDS